MFTTTRRLAIASAVLALSSTACGNDTPADARTRTADDTRTADATGSEDSGATSEGEPEVAGSPLEQLFGSIGDSQRFVEDHVTTCMRERGWEYEPRTGGTMVISSGPGRDPDFAAQYGYGISTRPPVDELFVGATEEGPSDPNAAFIDSLSDDDRDRFFADLTGMPPIDRDGEVSGEGDVVMIDAGDVDPDSCLSQGQRAAAEEHPELSDAFRDRMRELMQGIDDDPAMVEATAQWSACMADADYPYESREEVMADLSQRYTQITGEDLGDVGGEADGGGEGGVVIARRVGLDGEELDLSPADEERLTRLQADELAIAGADLVCTDEHLAAVRTELEREAAEKLLSEYPGLGVDE